MTESHETGSPASVSQASSSQASSVQASSSRREGVDPRVQTWAGRDLDLLTMDAARDGDLGPDDLRLHPDSLLRQAEVAAAEGNSQLAGSLQLAAELALLPDSELLGLYDMLRPGRASLDAMTEAVRLLEGLGMPRAAAHVQEAAAWYTARGLIGD